MSTSAHVDLQELPSRPLRPALLAALAAAAVDAFYVYMMYEGNPVNLHKSRVLFWTAYTATIAFAAALGAVFPNRRVQLMLLSLALSASLIAGMLGILSIGILYALPLVLSVVALRRTVARRIGITDALISGGAFITALCAMVEGLSFSSLTGTPALSMMS